MVKKRCLIVILLVVAGIITAFVVAVTVIGSQLDKGLSVFETIKLSDPELAAIPDGTYRGSFEQMPISVEVEVVVKDHTITDITLLKHNNGMGGAAEVIPEQVVAAQSVESINIVAGATYSSKAILKAIEQALTSAA